MASPLSHYLVDFGSSVRRAEPWATRGKPPSMQPLKAMLGNAAETAAEALAHAREQAALAVRAEYEQRLAEEREQFAARLAAERAEWVSGEAEKLAAQLSASVRELTSSLADTLARILRPFLVETLRQQVVDGLLEKLGVLLAHDRDIVIEISGPGDLLASLRDKLGSFPATIEYRPSEDADVRVVANQTVIETQLEAWFQRIGASHA